MNNENRAYYQALKSHDHRFDGRFFVGVTSTHIYCRPICPAPLPKEANCRFFPSAAAAQQAGFRPCKRCRPELAPGLACVDMPGSIVDKAMQHIQQGYLNQHNSAQLAKRLGITDRHLRRLFQQHLGASPSAVAINHRLLTARHMVADTQLPITDIAFAAGFGSVRAMNHAFRQYLDDTPQAIRKHPRVSAATTSPTLTLKLAYRPPFDWPAALSFLQKRCIPGVEMVTSDTYRRSLSIPSPDQKKEKRGWLAIENLPATCQLRITLDANLAYALPCMLRGVRHLFDVDCDPLLIQQRLSPLADARPGLRLIGAFDGFEMSVRAVLGQLITVKAAHTLAARLAQTYGERIDTPFIELSHCFPTPEQLVNAPASDIGQLGITRQKVQAIQTLAQQVIDGALDLSPDADIDQTLAALQSIPGIGPWTANYIAMRALHYPDAFLADDLGVKKALAPHSLKDRQRLAENWRPWRAYAVMHLWHLPDNHPPLPVGPPITDE